jgi:predicted nucleotidyltransferase
MLRILRNNLRTVRKSVMLDALFPQVRQGVLAATLLQHNKWWYLSELAQFLKTTPSSLQRELSRLVEAGILMLRRDGRRTYFKAETRSPIFQELRQLLNKTAGVVPLLQQALLPFGDRIICSFIYGSVARNTERALSDVDLMVVGNAGLADLAPVLRKSEKLIAREISVISYSPGEFRKRVAEGDHFLSTVLKEKLQFIKGDRSELDKLISQ